MAPVPNPLTLTFTFMHLADDLQCIQAIHFFYQYVRSRGIEPTTRANTMLYHWATGTTINQSSINQSIIIIVIIIIIIIIVTL